MPTVHPPRQNRANNRQSNAFSLMSSQRFGSEYLKATGNSEADNIDQNPESDEDHDDSMLTDERHLEDGSVEAFLSGAG